jgi:hypothetical protein
MVSPYTLSYSTVKYEAIKYMNVFLYQHDVNFKLQGLYLPQG